MAVASFDTSLRFLLKQLNESTYLKTDKEQKFYYFKTQPSVLFICWFSYSPRTMNAHPEFKSKNIVFFFILLPSVDFLQPC